ncbi:MAG: hypothetical protein WAU45_16155 [Blastocatellia bacterium]
MDILLATVLGDWSRLYLVAAFCGLGVGVLVWYIVSLWIATSLEWAETQHPKLAGTRKLRIAEGVACGALLFACVALTCWIAWLVWIQIK